MLNITANITLECKWLYWQWCCLYIHHLNITIYKWFTWHLHLQSKTSNKAHSLKSSYSHSDSSSNSILKEPSTINSLNTKIQHLSIHGITKLKHFKHIKEILMVSSSSIQIKYANVKWKLIWRFLNLMTIHICLLLLCQEGRVWIFQVVGIKEDWLQQWSYFLRGCGN